MLLLRHALRSMALAGIVASAARPGQVIFTHADADADVMLTHESAAV
jgi:hypothetical protein